MDVIPEEFRHLPKVDVLLGCKHKGDGDELMSLLLNLSATSDAELVKILENELNFAEIFHDCVKYDGFSVERGGANKVYVWPTLRGTKIQLFSK